jgi:acyl dehydratase
MTAAKPRSTLKWADINVGDEVTQLEIPITTTMIVAGAIASRDFMPVHHDRDYANKQGSPNLFMNILTTNGYCVRFLTDWAGPEAELRSLTFGMRTQSCAGDMLTVTGKVGRTYRGEDGACLVDIVDMNIAHPLAPQAAVATATVSLPSRDGERARMPAAPPGGDVPVPDDTPDFARPFVGRLQPGGYLPERPLTKDEIHLWCEALEDWNPLYWDEEYAAASRHGGIVAPATGSFFGAGSAAGLGVGYMKPGKTIPDGVRRGLTGIPLLQALRQSLVTAGSLVQPPGCPEIAVVQAAQRYYVPVRPGDTLRAEVVMKGCSPRKSTKLGDGYFIASERRFFNQRNELTRTMGMNVFHYHVR